MKPTTCVSFIMIALMLSAPGLELSAQEALPGLPVDDHPSSAFHTGGWILIGAGTLFEIVGTLLLVEGFTSDNQDTADFGKMMGISVMLTGGLTAGVGVFLIRVPIR